jgi:hypothetical protein
VPVSIFLIIYIKLKNERNQVWVYPCAERGPHTIQAKLQDFILKRKREGYLVNVFSTSAHGPNGDWSGIMKCQFNLFFSTIHFPCYDFLHHADTWQNYREES